MEFSNRVYSSAAIVAWFANIKYTWSQQWKSERVNGISELSLWLSFLLDIPLFILFLMTMMYINSRSSIKVFSVSHIVSKMDFSFSSTQHRTSSFLSLLIYSIGEHWRQHYVSKAFNFKRFFPSVDPMFLSLSLWYSK